MSISPGNRVFIALVVVVASAVAFVSGAGLAGVVALQLYRAPEAEAPVAPPPPPPRECVGDGQVCVRSGSPGTCLAERCVLPSGLCNYDLDCDDGNPCTETRCDHGTCTAAGVEGACTLDGGDPGVCVDRGCSGAPPAQCATDADCPNLEGTCDRWRCDSGACKLTAVEDGAECRLASGLEGTCGAGTCARELVGEVRNGTTCSTKMVPYGYFYRVPVRDCDPGLIYRLTDEERDRAAAKVEDELFKSLRYSMTVRLVPLADGGYNVVAFNRHDRTTVEGLVDPSFVAFTIAGLTSSTPWRSRQLHVWLRPYEEGWAIPTAGSRFAVSKGRASSALGFLGVVDVPAFRKYLQQSFVPLPRTAPDPDVAGQVQATPTETP